MDFEDEREATEYCIRKVYDEGYRGIFNPEGRKRFNVLMEEVWYGPRRRFDVA